jgi:NitT/TauT family transport system substrate-binding protein
VNHRYRRRALIAAPLLLVLAACTRESPPPPLRIAVNVWPGYDTLWLAEQLGFTAAEGVAVRILTTDGLGASRRLLKLGEADLIGGTLVELIASSAYDGCAPRAISLLNVSLGPDVILARPGINGVAELRGRRVGIEPGTSDLLLLAAALRAHGLAPDDIREVPLSHPAKLAALRAGEVDAVCTYPPEAEETVRATGARRIFSSADAPGAIIDVLIADAATVRARGRELAALLRANQRALDALRTDPAARRLFARRGGVTEEELARQLAGLELPRLSSQPARFGPGGTVRLATEGAIRALRDYGALTRDIPAAELLEPAVLREALNPR